MPDTVKTHHGLTAEREWLGWPDAQLIAYEERLYDEEVNGDDVWLQRDAVLWEMNRRGLCRRKA